METPELLTIAETAKLLYRVNKVSLVAYLNGEEEAKVEEAELPAVVCSIW